MPIHFQDDFETCNLADNWDTPIDPHWTCQSGTKKQGTYAAKGHADQTGYHKLIHTQNFSGVFYVKFWTLVTLNGAGLFGFFFPKGDDNVEHFILCGWYSKWQYRDKNSQYKPWPENLTYSLDTWYYVELLVNFPEEYIELWITPEGGSKQYGGKVALSEWNLTSSNYFVDVRAWTAYYANRDVYLDDYKIESYQISGVTRDSNGNPLGGCTVWLFRTSNKKFIDEKTSDGNGNYTFTVSDTTTEYFVKAHKDETPNVFGVTDRDLKGTQGGDNMGLVKDTARPKIRLVVRKIKELEQQGKTEDEIVEFLAGRLEMQILKWIQDVQELYLT